MIQRTAKAFGDHGNGSRNTYVAPLLMLMKLEPCLIDERVGAAC